MTYSAEQTVSTYLSRYNAGDVAGIVSMFSDDATIEDPVGTPPIVGRSAIHEFVTRAISYAVRLQGPDPLMVCGSEAAFCFEASFDTGGSRFSFKVIDTIELNGAGQIVRLRAYLNPSDLHSAIGAQ